jgi:hypothetical protein
MSDRTPRRWLMFSLRSLFLLVLVVAAYFAGWRSATWTAEREKEAAVRKAVEELQAGRAGSQPEVSINYIPALDSAVLTGPQEQTDRVLRFLEMQKFFGKAPFGSKGSFTGNSGDADDSPPPRSPQEQP